MIWSFGDHPNTAAYSAITPTQSMAELNPPGKKSIITKEDTIGHPDAVNPDTLNHEIWNSATGGKVPMPAPQHHVFSANMSGGDGDGD